MKPSRKIQAWHSNVVIELTQNYKSTARNDSDRIYQDEQKKLPQLHGPTLVNRVNPVKADWRINPPVRSFTMKTRPVQSEGSRLTEEGEIIGFH